MQVNVKLGNGRQEQRIDCMTSAYHNKNIQSQVGMILQSYFKTYDQYIYLGWKQKYYYDYLNSKVTEITNSNTHQKEIKYVNAKYLYYW